MFAFRSQAGLGIWRKFLFYIGLEHLQAPSSFAYLSLSFCLFEHFVSLCICVCVCVCSVTLSRSYGVYAARLLCPWDFPGKNTGVGRYFLLQGIFLLRGYNPHLLCLLHERVDSLPLSHIYVYGCIFLMLFFSFMCISSFIF